MDGNGIVRAGYTIPPCFEDVVSFTIGHENYDQDRLILIDAAQPVHNHVTLRSARNFVRDLIGSLKDHDVGPDSVVCLHMFNSVKYPLIVLAVIGTGAKVTAANPAYTSSELRHHFSVSETTHVISCNEKYKIAMEAVKRVPDIIEPMLCTVQDIDGFAARGSPQPWLKFTDDNVARKTVAVLNSTSGTTGLPKMAARSHYSIVMECIAIQDVAPKDYEERRLLCTPFFHGFTMPLAVIAALRFGIETYVMHRFSSDHFLAFVKDYDIKETAMPPPLLIHYLNMDPSHRQALKGLRKVWTGGAPLRQETQYRVRAMFHLKVCIAQVWGMTEGGWMTTFPHPENDKSGSVGRLIATYEACVVVEEDDGAKYKIRDYNRTGEILVRGPINMLGYHNDPSATNAIIDEQGWLHTGDLGYIDNDGRIYVVERLKDMIKAKGFQVSPAELEARLISHPAISDAAVIGMEKPHIGTEVPLIFVVLEEDLDPKDLKAYLGEHIARYKVEHAEIRIVEKIPKSASGKILKNELRKQI
ncbi:AMP-binding enzyme [Elsinoe ampelina]|uniref:AMP-binding enzyme n=1 Tax=Elsinoe ampelina TaxID=302913 RepID=A0A6A6G504_9PEZI|nr:AMP-binding enzyme [Elsinoe ampelina]